MGLLAQGMNAWSSASYARMEMSNILRPYVAKCCKDWANSHRAWTPGTGHIMPEMSNILLQSAVYCIKWPIAVNKYQCLRHILPLPTSPISGTRAPKVLTLYDFVRFGEGLTAIQSSAKTVQGGLEAQANHGKPACETHKALLETVLTSVTRASRWSWLCKARRIAVGL